jgi:hypothetical protein
MTSKRKNKLLIIKVPKLCRNKLLAKLEVEIKKMTIAKMTPLLKASKRERRLAILLL